MSREDISKGMVRAMCQALAGRPPSTFPRHRWTGVDISLDELGLMQCIHGVLTHAYCAFLVACGHKGARCWSYNLPQIGDGRPSGLLTIADGPAIGEPVEVDSDSDAEELQPEPEERLAEPPEECGTTDWATINARARRVGCIWIQSIPLGKLMLFRKVAEPFRVLMAAHFKLASAAWERRQKCAEAASQGETTSGQRHYRIAIAASHELEDKFIADTESLCSDDDFWALMPNTDRTLRFQALAFRMVSRMGCAVHELLYAPHDRFPSRLFLLLTDATLWDVFGEADPCELDSFSKGFIERYSGAELGGRESIACLDAIARVLKMDISDIESKHASLRRYLKAAPLAKTPRAKLLSAIWACCRFGKRQAELTRKKSARAL